MTDENKTKIEFRRLGGFVPLPFFPSKLVLADFEIKWNHWIIVDSFEVFHEGRAFLKVNSEFKIILQGKVAGFFRDAISWKREGERIEGRLANDAFSTECLFKNGKITFVSRKNGEEIGLFEWKNEQAESITGYVLKEKILDSWFVGMSLMKIWRFERDLRLGP